MTSAADRLHRREAKAARRRHRQAIGKTGGFGDVDSAARTAIGGANLTDLRKMAGGEPPSTLRIFRKPGKLRHVAPDRPVAPRLMRDLGLA